MNEVIMEERIKRAVEILRKENTELPRFIQQVISLYNIGIPVFYGPQVLTMHITDGDFEGLMWGGLMWTDRNKKKPLGIFIANDAVREDHKNKNLALLKIVLHEIGHVVLHKETKELVERLAQEIPPKYMKENEKNLFLIGCMESKVEDWAKKEWRKLRLYVNTKYTDWKRKYKFDEMKNILKYDKKKDAEFINELFSFFVVVE